MVSMFINELLIFFSDPKKTQLLSSEPGMQHRGIDSRNTYEDQLAFMEGKEGKAVSNVSNNDQVDDHMSLLLPLVPLSASTEPSAPPIPEYSPCFPNSPVADSATIGTEANLLANYEVHGEQLDFKGMGLVDEVYLHWLNEVFHHQPSFIECQRNRTREYAGWAFTALGRVLQFLETKKVAEMNEEACECLQQLWDEVQVFGFDLSWLKPQVEFALSMKGYMEKLREVNRLEEEKRSLELRIQELSVKLIETEKEIKSCKGYLAKSSVGSAGKAEPEKFLGILQKSMTISKNQVIEV